MALIMTSLLFSVLKTPLSSPSFIFITYSFLLKYIIRAKLEIIRSMLMRRLKITNHFLKSLISSILTYLVPLSNVRKRYIGNIIVIRMSKVLKTRNPRMPISTLSLYLLRSLFFFYYASRSCSVPYELRALTH